MVSQSRQTAPSVSSLSLFRAPRSSTSSTPLAPSRAPHLQSLWRGVFSTAPQAAWLTFTLSLRPSSTGTSSRRTCSSRTTGRSRCPTLAWRGSTSGRRPPCRASGLCSGRRPRCCWAETTRISATSGPMVWLHGSSPPQQSPFTAFPHSASPPPSRSRGCASRSRRPPHAPFCVSWPNVGPRSRRAGPSFVPSSTGSATSTPSPPPPPPSEARLPSPARVGRAVGRAGRRAALPHRCRLRQRIHKHRHRATTGTGR
mmetsp:Transcript_26649/g.86085  ORF Transcript_26649/g.86085 Transcript_26649/m.86085 type:complete len:256 (-) Transcript_26649:788-1555(-)